MSNEEGDPFSKSDVEAFPTREPDSGGYYATLGVSEHATAQEIRQAFLHLSQRYHTDKHANQSEEAKEAMNTRFQELQDAYTVLSDERQRAAYDAAGLRGIKGFELVPRNVQSRHDVIDFIHSLERESNLVRTAKMLSATTDMTLNFSVAHLFLPTMPIMQESSAPHLVPTATPDAAANSAQGEAAASSSSASPAVADHVETSAAAASHPEAVEKTETAAEKELAAKPGAPPAAGATAANSSTPAGAAAPAAGGAKAPAAGGAAHSAGSVTAQMSAVEVEINGKKQIVLVPGEELQSRIRAQMAAAGVGGGGGAGGGAAGAAPECGQAATAGGPQGGPQRITRRPLTPSEALAFAIVPKSITLRHSFVHTVSPRLAIQFRSDARSEGRKASISATAEAEYQRDSIRTYGFTVRAAVTGLKSTFLYQRLISPIWTLSNKITLLNKGEILDKVELTLERKLSEFTSLENTLALSLSQYGFFRSQLRSADNKGQQGLTTYISYHGMTMSIYSVSSLLYGIDTKDPNRKPARGRVQYTINCSPFSGQTHIGFEAWYYKSVLKHFGIGFMTILPYSVSPIAPPLFLVASSQFAVVNQVSLLYERGQHRISIPIIALISPEISRAVLWLSVPLLLYRMGRLLYRPYARANASKYYLYERKKHLAEMDIAYQRALLEQRALEIAVMQGSAAEDRKGGLVIINAQYGVLEPEFCDPALLLPSSATAPGAEEPGLRRRRPWLSTIVSTVADGIVKFLLRRSEKRKAELAKFGSSASLDGAAATETAIPLVIDVTIALQNLVRDSALSLPGGTKSKLVGFCDPDPYTPEKKELKITYWFQKKRHVVVYHDEDEVTLPQRDHLVS